MNINKWLFTSGAELIFFLLLHTLPNDDAVKRHLLNSSQSALSAWRMVSLSTFSLLLTCSWRFCRKLFFAILYSSLSIYLAFDMLHHNQLCRRKLVVSWEDVFSFRIVFFWVVPFLSVLERYLWEYLILQWLPCYRCRRHHLCSTRRCSGQATHQRFVNQLLDCFSWTWSGLETFQHSLIFLWKIDLLFWKILGRIFSS